MSGLGCAWSLCILVHTVRWHRVLGLGIVTGLEVVPGCMVAVSTHTRTYFGTVSSSSSDGSITRNRRTWRGIISKLRTYCMISSAVNRSIGGGATGSTPSGTRVGGEDGGAVAASGGMWRNRRLGKEEEGPCCFHPALLPAVLLVRACSAWALYAEAGARPLSLSAARLRAPSRADGCCRLGAGVTTPASNRASWTSLLPLPGSPTTWHKALIVFEQRRRTQT